MFQTVKNILSKVTKNKDATSESDPSKSSTGFFQNTQKCEECKIKDQRNKELERKLRAIQRIVK
ncbi:MAG: hypothetical protein ACI86H_002756 [bacterium]|jgi:hypothetical protein